MSSEGKNAQKAQTLALPITITNIPKHGVAENTHSELPELPNLRLIGISISQHSRHLQYGRLWAQDTLMIPDLVVVCLEMDSQSPVASKSTKPQSAKATSQLKLDVPH